MGTLQAWVLKKCDDVCGKRGGGDVKEIHGEGMKRLRRQFQGRKKRTRHVSRQY